MLNFLDFIFGCLALFVVRWAHQRETRVYAENLGVPTTRTAPSKMTFIKWTAAIVAGLCFLTVLIDQRWPSSF